MVPTLVVLLGTVVVGLALERVRGHKAESMVTRAPLKAVFALLLIGAPLGAGDGEEARRAALAAADELQGLTGEIARGLWDLSETAVREERSAELLAGVLAGEGFAVETGVASKVISLTAVDMVTDPELVAAAKRDFLERTEGRPYRSPIPEDQAPPVP